MRTIVFQSMKGGMHVTATNVAEGGASPSGRSPEPIAKAPAPGALAAAFLRHCAAASPARNLADLEGELAARLSAGRTTWVEVALDHAIFARYLAERSGDGLPPLSLASDLYLACACASGEARAIYSFRQAFHNQVGRAIARTDPSPGFVDEVMQVLSVKLFVRTGEGAPAIVEYEGRASLRGWVATIARRTALNLRRRKADRAHDEVASGVRELGTAVGPELALLKARYKGEFEASIRAGLASLSDKERTLLLLHLVNGLTLPQLAAMQNVSRATVARWLAAAREALFLATRQALVERLRLSPSEYESVLGLVRSQLEVSIVDVLVRQPAD
jgi:RNA polymerase sigma-70 factor (ECF subfamily)